MSCGSLSNFLCATCEVYIEDLGVVAGYLPRRSQGMAVGVSYLEAELIGPRLAQGRETPLRDVCLVPEAVVVPSGL